MSRHGSGHGTSSDLHSLLGRLKAHAPVAERHVWLLDLLDWVRGPGQSVVASTERVALFLDAVQERPDLQARLPNAFGRLPKAKVEIKRVPPEIEAGVQDGAVVVGVEE